MTILRRRTQRYKIAPEVYGQLSLLKKIPSFYKKSLRILELVCLFSPLIICSPLLFSFPDLYNKILIKTVEASGPAFIKLSQYISSRSDLFPKSLCQALQPLQDAGTPLRISIPGLQLGKLLGVGSIAQVYAVSFNGKHAALKVLKPSAKASVALDLSILNTLARSITRIVGPSLDLINQAETFAKMMRDQLDLSIEGANLERFEKNFKNSPLVAFPTVFSASPSLLIENHLPGLPINRLLELKASPFHADLAQTGLHAFLVFYRFL